MAVGYKSDSSASQFQDELAAATGGRIVEGFPQYTPEEEALIAQEIDEEQNKKRRDARKELVKNAVKQKIKQEAEKKAKDVLVKTAVRTGLRSAVVYFSGTIGTFLAIAAALIVAVFLIIFALKYTCETEGWKGTVVRGAGTVASWFGYEEYNVCERLAIIQDAANNTPTQLPAVPPPTTGDGLDLVAITGVPTGTSGDFRLRSCMLRRVQIIYNNAQALGIDFIITSAYRPGATVGSSGRLSAHGKGEAVDIVIVPRGQLNDPAFQAKIRKLVQLSTNEGFVPPRGDTLDEYNNPTEAATGGHVHIEFNTAPNNGSYCGVVS
ncbi:MAG TPA: hypothetical protein VEC17_00645 [Candidatus Binatia bacterium]|nr:hypothetical protein [Candidatus Binatia bacterium]